MILSLTKEQREEVIKRCNISYAFDEEAHIKLVDSKYYPYKHYEIESFLSRCYCSKNHGKIIHKNICPYCGKEISNISNPKMLLPKEKHKELIQKLKNEGLQITSYPKDPSTKITVSNFVYYVCKHPSEKTGIAIYSLNYSISHPNDLKNTDDIYAPEIDVSISSVVEIIPNKGTFAYNIKKGKGKNPPTINESDIFSILRINSKTVTCPYKYLWENSKNMADFLNNNPVFASYSGIKDALSFADNTIMASLSFFIFYMAFYSLYPPVEQLVKAGHVKIVTNLIEEISQKTAAQIPAFIKSLNTIINPEAKSSKDVFPLPAYISDYLRDIESSYYTYDFFSKIYYYDPLSKENFEKLIDSEQITYIINLWPQSHVKTSLIEVLKHGYTLNSVISYLEKQFKTSKPSKENTYTNDTSFRFPQMLNYLKDYLFMCEITGTVPEKFPSQLLEAHDSLSKLVESQKSEKENLSLEHIYNKYIPFIPEHEKYTIVLPKTTQAFIEEGLNQHNCVASYVNRVIKNDGCLVFFIRKKDDPNSSFVTAECSTYTGECSQVMYSYNRRVNDPEILNFANKFSSKLI